MKKTLFILTVLALGFTACNKADLQDSQEQSPETIAEAPVYKVNISASLGADTKAVAYDDVSGGLASTFRTTDNIKVFNKMKNVFAEDKDYHSMSLHANADAKTANLVGELAFYKYPNYRQVDTGDKLLLMYNMDEGSFYYTVLRENPDGTYGQKGTLAGLNDYDYATAEVTITGISGAGTADSPYTLATSDASFTNIQSMFKLTFTGMPDNFSPSIGDYDGDKGINSITIHSAKNKLVYEDLYDDNCFFGNLEIKLGGMGGNALMAREANGAGNVVYAALRFLPLGAEETDEITFTMECTDEKTYLAKKTSPVGGFQNGKYYTSTIEAYPKIVNLNKVTTTDGNGLYYYAAKDGQVLSGSFGYGGYVTIADGATVTLNGVDIQVPNDCDHAGIHCLGSANIVVSGTGGNQVYAGFGSYYPAVYVPHNASGTEYTLTISGTGTLNADSGNSTGAGIGGGYDYDSNTGIPCGNIVLSGATIMAQGGQFSAGIGGGGYSSCGTITINGANVIFANGGYGGAGIGSGEKGTCGDITISSGSVGEDYSNFVGSDGCAASIGCGDLGTCGTITITSGITSVYAKKAQYAPCYIGGSSGGYVKVIIDGVEMTYSQLQNGFDSNPDGASPVLPNLHSFMGPDTWSLWK